MNDAVLVTGGTGTLGKRLVPRLVAAGYDVRVLARHAGKDSPCVTYHQADLDTGEGMEAAAAGAGVIVHLAGAQTGDEVKTRHLVEVAGGARHLVYISVVGADLVPVRSRTDRAMFGYYASKRAAEEVVEEGGIPWTMLRATQFHDLLFTFFGQLARLPVFPVFSGVRFQPVETGEVAARLAELAAGPPAGLVADLGGPQTYAMGELVRGYLRATGKYRARLPLRPPGAAARAMRAGANLAPDHAAGRRTWEAYLADAADDPAERPAANPPARRAGRSRPGRGC
jgi:uncharacterized protein YbjT (DUF2867 family)